MRLLFLDIVDHEKAENLMEGAIIARTLKFKREWDFLYGNDTRFYTPIVTENEYGRRVNNRTVVGRANKLKIATLPLFDSESFVEALSLHIPHILFVGAHGWNNPGRWITHRNISIKLGTLRKRIKEQQINLKRTCLVTNSCRMGNNALLRELKEIGFGSVIAWPRSTCMTETLSFHIDFFEAVMFQYLYRHNGSFWSWKNGHPPKALIKAYSFARENLAQRYKCLNKHFPSQNVNRSEKERSEMAGYYLHTDGWKGTIKDGYSEYPILSQFVDR